MVNKYRPHVFILPEDGANRQIANGFLLQLSTRQVYILPEAGGWTQVLDCFASDHVVAMEQNSDRHMILLIDFDGIGERLGQARARIPQHVGDRVFILGVLNEPEELRLKIGQSYETIGSTIAQDCRDNTDLIWSHALLRHNAAEVERLRRTVCAIMFPD